MDGWNGMEWMVGEYKNRMRLEKVKICYEEALSWTDHSEKRWFEMRGGA